MTADSELVARLAAVEARLGLLEDREAICRLIASYGPSADGMSRAGLEAIWTAGGTYETEHHTFTGAPAIGAIVEDPMHLDFIAQGCAHVLSYPHVLVSGDAAVATNYSRVYVLRDGEWHVARAAANRWELARGPDGAWRVERRVNRLMSGSAESRALLAQGLDPSG